MRLALSALASAVMLACAGSTLAADKPIKAIGVTVGDLANPFFVAIGKGAEDEAKKLSAGAKVTTVSSKYDLNTQVGQIENFIANKVDMILVNAADPKGIAPALKKAKDAGIVVMAVDVGAEGATGTVMSDNTMAGVESCKFLSDKLGGKGNVVIVNGPPVTAVIDRVKGCKEVLAKSPGIKILSDNQDGKGSRDGGMEVMANLLTAHKQIDGVFSINDPQSIGADLAIKQAKRTDIKLIASVDGAPDAEVALKDPKSLLAVTTAQNPYKMAAEAVKMGYDIMNGRGPKSTTMLIPTPPVTKENVAQYKGWTKN